MWSKSVRTATLWVGVGVCASAAFGQATLRVASHRAPFVRTNIADFGRNPDGVTMPDAQAIADQGPALAPLFWDNGLLDNVTAHLSQQTSIGNFYAADDFIIKQDFWACIDTLTVCFAISDTIDGVMAKPTFGLIVYNDCNGRPDTVAYTEMDPSKITATLVGPSLFAGFNLWTVTFEIHQFVDGYQRPWISVFGIGDLQDAQYYWLSANNGLIQGAQAQLKNGSEPWMDVQTCDCPGICTDLYFEIAGRQCCLAKNNIPFDPNGGAKSLQLKGATIDTARAADNFQIGPYEPQSLCAVEAWVATNCPLDKFYLEIYENVCNMPGNKLFTIDLEDQPTWEPADGLAYQGVPIYRLFWKLDGPVLQPGQDYWLSVVGRGTGSILDKAYWMFLEPGACNINITEGKVKDPYVPGMEDFTFVSACLVGPPRDFAFRLWTSPLPAPPQTGACCIGSAMCIELTRQDCEAQQGLFVPGETCITVICVSATVACCFSDGSCIDLPDLDCLANGGTFGGPDCATASCAPFVGACCLSGTGCVDLAPDDCLHQVGVSFDPDHTCAQTSCAGELGACCFASKSVVGCGDDYSQHDCEGLGGIFAGLGITCATTPCASYYGACCISSGNCLDDSFMLDCDAIGGVFGAGSTCLDTCPDACCLDDGTCTEMLQAACTSVGGTPQPGLDCSIALCPQPTGACCFPDGSCIDLTEGDCIGAAGVFDPDPCAQVSCPQPPVACCFPDGSCSDLLDIDCASAGGSYNPGTTCATFSCPQPPGACCFPDGSCTDLTEGDCIGAAGVFDPDPCAQVSCPQLTGACCLSDGTCIDLTAADCSFASGSFVPAVMCASYQCPQAAGACCLGSMCLDMDQATCSALIGTYNFGESCSTFSCGDK